MAEIAYEDDLKLSLLIEGVVLKIQTETKTERSRMICDAIRFHINTWLDQVEEIDPRYKVSELIPVGSYAEGTKILQADEFDYLAVIEGLSKPDVIIIDARENDIKCGLVKVIVADEELKSKWSNLCKDGHLKCFQPVNFPGSGENRFGHVVIQILWRFVKNSKRIGPTTGSPTDIDCKILLPTVNKVSLFFCGALFRAPNVFIKFKDKNNDREISVDVSPAIRYHKIQDCFREDECAGPLFAGLVLSRKSLLLIGTSFESFFKVTVTEAEVEYILTVMKPEHKMIYVFLKYVVKLYADKGSLSSTFTSYMMKTVCLHHDMKCKENNKSLVECLKSVIQDLQTCTQRGFAVSIINRHIHLKYSYMDESVENDRKCLLQGMVSMCQLPREIETVDNFDSFLRHIVWIEWQKRAKAAEERDREDREYRDKFRTELEERVSNIVEMGFDHDEVKKVMENTLYDSELAVKILLKNASQQEGGQIKEIGSCSPSLEIIIPTSETHSLTGEDPCNVATGKISKSRNSSQNGSSNSEEFPLAVYSPQETVSHEILYQRQKDV